MNAAEARGAAPDTVRHETRTVLNSFPPEEFPALTQLADHLTAPTMNERFTRGLRALLDGLTT